VSISKYTIKTEHVYPPIPVRHFDWRAWFDEMGEDAGNGWGKTEIEAIADLREKYGIECRQCGKHERDFHNKTCSVGGCPIGADL
jgi:hypothetical protein